MQQKEEIEFSDFEQYKIKEIEDSKKYFNTKIKFSIKSFLSELIFKCIVGFSTKINWQICLVSYLIIVCPIGTYYFFKELINFLF